MSQAPTESLTDAVEAPETQAPAAESEALETPAGIAALTNEITPESQPVFADPQPAKYGYHWGTGRRKSAVARVRIRPVAEGGETSFLVSSTKARSQPVEEFFSEPQHRAACLKPLEVTDTLKGMQVFVNVKGGGITGQAEAILLGVARALKAYDPSTEPLLRDHGLLTRDAREVERKKYGQRGARRRFQFSKR